MNKAKVLKTAKPISIKDSSISKIVKGEKNTIIKLFSPKYLSLYSDENNEVVINTLNYEINDIIYVREAWQRSAISNGKKFNVKYHYKADEPDYATLWNSLLSMPMDAIRIIAKITSIRVDRIQDLYANIENVEIDDDVSETDIQYYYNNNIWVYTLTFKMKD